MSRRLVISVLAVAGSLALASAAGIAFRLPLVAWLAEHQLAALGIPNASLTVERVGWREARIINVGAGLAGELRLAELVAGYRPMELLTGQLDRLAVKGLSLRLDLTGNRAALGTLQAPLDDLIGQPEETAASERRLPEITLAEVRVEALTPVGPATLAVDGRIEPRDGRTISTVLDLTLSGASGELTGQLSAERSADGRVAGDLGLDRGVLSIGEDGLVAELLESKLSFAWRGTGFERLNGDLSLQDIRFAGSDLGAAALHLDADESDLSASIRLGTGDGGFDLKGRLDIADLPGEPEVAAELELAAAAEASIWRLTPLPPPEAGRGHATFKLKGDLPVVIALERQPGQWLPWLLESRLEGEARVELENVTVPGEVSKLSAVVPVKAELDRGLLDLTLRLDAGLDTAGLPARWLAELGLPKEMLGPRLTVKLAADGGEPLELRLTPGEMQTAFELNGALALDAKKHLALAVAGELRGAVDQNLALTGLSSERLELSANSPALARTPITALSLASLLTFDLASDNGRLEHEVTAASSRISFHVNRAGRPPFTMQWAFDRLTLSGASLPDEGHQGTFRLDNGQLIVPEFALALEGLSASVPLGAKGLGEEIRFRVEAIKDLNQPPYYHPLNLVGRLKPRGTDFDVAVEIKGPGDVGRVVVTGWLNPVEARGNLRVVLEPLIFAPKGAQPAGLSPWLAKLGRTEGEVEGDAQIAWGPKSQGSGGAIALRDLSFEFDGIPVARLRLGLRLDDLLSPSSPPGQLLLADEIDIGVPLKDISVRFQLLQGTTPRVRVERAEFAALGGRFGLEDAVIDPAQPHQTLQLQVVDLELADLFDAIKVEGLTGRGRISGVVPLSVGPDGVAVLDAALGERSPGQLHFKSPAATQALRSGGESVELMLQALEDFHYERLKLTGEKAADGEVRLRIELQGSNPAVLDGRAFRFNITLTGNLNPLLSALIQGRQLSSDLLRRTWRLRQ